MSESWRELTGEEDAAMEVALRAHIEAEPDGQTTRRDFRAAWRAARDFHAERVVPVSSELPTDQAINAADEAYSFLSGVEELLRQEGSDAGLDDVMAKLDAVSSFPARPVVGASGEREAVKRKVEEALEDAFDNGQGMDVERLAERAMAASRLDPMGIGTATRTPVEADAADAAATRVPDEAAEWERVWKAVGEREGAARAGETMWSGPYLEPGEHVEVVSRAEAEAKIAAASRVPSAPGDVVQCQAVLLGIGAEYDGKPLDARKLTLFYPSSSAPEQVERAARALCELEESEESAARVGGRSHPLGGQPPSQFEEWREEYERKARAVLDAVSGPPSGPWAVSAWTDNPSGPPEQVDVVIDSSRYRVRPDVAGEFLLSLRPLPRATLHEWQVWREVLDGEDVDAGWDVPLKLVGGERFYTTPKGISAGSSGPPESDEPMDRCTCMIPYLEGAGQHSPGCAVFDRPAGPPTKEER